MAAPRITRAIDETDRVILSQKPHRLARPEFDRGSAPAGLPMDRMMLVFQRTTDQTNRLKKLLDSQLRAGSPEFHRWLTAEQFGTRFGPADEDLKTIAGWLQSHGFVVQAAAKGKGTIEFSGTAEQVTEAFHTPIHRFVVKGEEHWASTGSPTIPAALAPVVAGIATLHNFHHKPRPTGKAISSRPLTNLVNGTHALAPADYATIYNINPLYQATPAVDGTGATIAVVGQGIVDPNDIADFRQQFGLTTYVPQLLYPTGQPTDTGSEPDVEGTLDVSWSGAIAPGAAIDFVAIPDTFADDGLFLSEIYIVDNNLADIVTESIGVCESDSDPSLNNFVEAIREQAAAQGMTYIVSAGDNGPYGCDDFTSELSVNDPTLVSVNLLAASPYVTAVGGTMFSEGATPSQFWSATQGRFFSSALSYIPEVAWDESCDSQFCFENILAGSGGQSSVYPKPTWQSGVTGIQQDSTRDLPDVSLTASSHDPYLLCYTGSCEQGKFAEVSGTSAAAPAFAGMMALLRQKTGSRLGAIDPQLYALAAAENYSNCNASLNTVASTCVFNDITVGSNGVNGEPNFETSTANYQATVGYDLATGLGSVNLANLVSNWTTSGERPTTATLAISPTTLVHGATANMTVSVVPATGAGVPSGPVDLNNATTSLGSFLLTAGTATSSVAGLPLTGGTYPVFALYGGDGTFAPSTSNSVSVTVTPEPTRITTEADMPCDSGPFCRFVTAPFGTPVEIGALVTGVSGVGAPTGTLTFTDSDSTTGGSLTLNVDGSAVFNGDTYAVGTHTITLTYPGDASFQPATARPLSFTIAAAPTSVLVTPTSFCGMPNTPFPLTAQVISEYNGVQEGTLTVVGSNPPITVPVTGISSLTLPSLPAGLNTITVSFSGDTNYVASTGTAVVNISSGTCLAATVNGADYQPGVAPQEIVSIFGVDLASSAMSAGAGPLPQSLNGTSVTITDSAGTTATADLFFVSPGQINCAVPKGLAIGASTMQITSPQGVSTIPGEIDPISPALFSADGSGTGLAAADIVRAHQSQLTTEAVTATPVAFNGDDLYLVLYGTGSSSVTPADYVEVLFNEQTAFPAYIGPQGGFEGLDQINVAVPYSLAGSGSVDIQLVVDGLTSNTVTVNFH